jgi:uncharacterized membrane protein
MHGGLLSPRQGGRMNTTTGFLVGTGLIALVSIPMMLDLVPRNRFYGFRTAATLASDATWYAANRFAGWALFIASIASALLLWKVPVDPNYAAVLFVLPLMIALLASFIHLRRISDGSSP